MAERIGPSGVGTSIGGKGGAVSFASRGGFESAGSVGRKISSPSPVRSFGSVEGLSSPVSVAPRLTLSPDAVTGNKLTVRSFSGPRLDTDSNP